MKKLIFFMISIFVFTSANAGPAYLCNNGTCQTLIETWDGGGYSWRITCNDGSYAEGTVPGASYGGGCEQLPEN